MMCSSLSAAACIPANSHWESNCARPLEAVPYCRTLDTFWLMAGGKWVLALQFLYGARCLAPTASGLNMIKILRRSTAQACRLNNQMLEMLKKMAGHWSGLCDVSTLCYLTDINVRNFCALSRCQQTSSRDGGRTLFAFPPQQFHCFDTFSLNDSFLSEQLWQE